ncbi:hypothetical protein POX_f07646 [Penicillium oxalicum]|uniref:Uncharacterized protein n=1 Tax=Penicillium oxalicum (strain 114-2 / CGMCC 5302) TaxID=933388 RepID=S8ARC7_PENO1|nr:hypothetical protein POX_f07646 [Penicillium oxalicum]EPS28563.1 hypothetical protein PDE_03509 [Penicillium oxalicum 114-2]KAI2787283.1 hypothetical protein POX_f07646 [Penicillium oxalicum]
MEPSDPLAAHPCSSRLEALPVEILQLIFFYSLEINLPRASPYLARALSKPIVYTWLIRLAFSSANTSSRQGLFTPDFLPPPLDFWDMACPGRQRLQTQLLECRWCTLPLMRRCQREYVEHVIRRKCANLSFSDEGKLLLGSFDDIFNDLEGCDRAPRGFRGKGDLVLPARLPGEESPPTVDRKVAIWLHLGAVQVREPNEVFYENDLFQLPCAPALGAGRIPDKLLQEPWSEEQFQFLELLSSDFYLDEDGAAAERSSEITTRLIRKRRMEPFSRLVRMYFRAANCRVPSRWPLRDSHFAMIQRCMEGPNDPFANVVLNARWDDIPTSARQDLLLALSVKSDKG